MSDHTPAGAKSHVELMKDVANVRREISELVARGTARGRNRRVAIFENADAASQYSALELETRVLQYRDLVAQIADRVDGWGEEIAVVTLPGGANGEDEEWGCSLDTLGQWPGTTATREKSTPGRGSSTELVEERLVLPPEASRQAFLKLNRILQENGLGFQIEIPDHTPDPL